MPPYTLALGASVLATFAIAELPKTSPNGVPASETVSTEPAQRPNLPEVTSATIPAAAPRVIWIDFDSDGHLDAHVLRASQSHLLRSTGTGEFENVTESAGLQGLGAIQFALWEDYDKNGTLDLFAGRVAGPGSILVNLGNGRLQDATEPSGMKGLAPAHAGQWFDFDGDGWKDLWLEGENGAALMRSVAGQVFEEVNLGLPAEMPLESAGSALPTGSSNVLGGATAGGRIAQSVAAGAPSLPDMISSKGKGLASPNPGTFTSAGQGGTGTTRSALITAPLSFDAAYVNDNGNEVDSADVIDGSLVGADVSTSSGDVTHTGGSVGIGVSNPLAPLHVGSDALFSGSAGTARIEMNDGTGPVLNMQGTSNVDEIARIKMRQANLSGFDMLYDGTSGIDSLLFENFAGGVLSPGRLSIIPGGDFKTEGADSYVHIDVDVFDSIGNGTNLEIGSTDPNAVFPAGILMRNSTGQGFNITQIDSTSTNGSLQIKSSENNTPAINVDRNTNRVTIGSNYSAATALDVNGAVTIRGGADIVETFESSCGPLEPGTVVVIDPDAVGELKCSYAAFDTKVAGVVSGAGGVKPGLLLGQDEMFTGDTKVAMTGRVYVKCSAENGAILPGDRLTTATLEGYAMRVAEGDRVDGAVIGKAMSRLDEGTGLVLVLVNLQ